MASWRVLLIGAATVLVGGWLVFDGPHCWLARA